LGCQTGAVMNPHSNPAMVVFWMAIALALTGGVAALFRWWL
jgi:hypothetical protein